ncbi:MAG: hypothetical protein RRB13_07305 [bacterium]|nr:hypothetical protein [bacterium]
MARSPKQEIAPDDIVSEGPAIKRLEEALQLPLPQRDDFWKISLPSTSRFSGKKIFKVFQKELPEDEIIALRKEAAQSPGKTMAQLQKLKKMHPYNPNLLMLSAICTHGINMNSSNPSAMFGALKQANKDAASALIFDGMSLYNFENFFRLYHLLLERYKRQFDKLSREFRGDKAALARAKMEFGSSMLDLLTDEMVKGRAVVGHLKKKIMANAYAHGINFERIERAAQSIEAGKPKEPVGYFTANETISFTYAFGVAAAKVPLLHPLVDRLMDAIPSLTSALAIRKVSIQSVRHFSLFRIAEAEKNEERMRRVAKVIFQENHSAMLKMENQPVNQPFEADPYLNLGLITYKCEGLFQPAEQAKMVATALTAAETLVRKDQTKTKAFTEAAQAHVRRLSSMTRETAAFER